MIFDDFNNVGEEDILFMESLYPIVEANGVLLFVLVQDEKTANRLIKLNNWGRIAPLHAICRNRGDEKNKIPDWQAITWKQSDIEEIVKVNLGRIPDGMQITDGQNPLDVLRMAKTRVIDANLTQAWPALDAGRGG